MQVDRSVPQPPPRAVSLRLFGEVRLSQGGSDCTPRGRKARALVAYLAVAKGQCASRERIADLLWGDRGDEQARGSLRQVLAELRAGPLDRHGVLTVSRDTIGLAPGTTAVDVEIIAAAAAAGDLATLAAELDNSEGSFLGDLQDLSPAFDEWLEGERVRQHDGVVGAAHAAAEAAIGRGDSVHVRGILSSLERLDPGNEHVARLGLQADHAAGDTASLHRRFRRLTDLLAREFDTRPSDETRALFHRLTTVAPAAPAPAAPDPGSLDAAAVVEPPMVMVSPLVAVDTTPASASLAAICTDDIRVALAQHRDLRIVALETVDLERITSVCSGALASYMLSGTARHGADGLRINIQLANIGAGLVVWSEQLRIEPDQLGEAVDRIVARAAGAVAPAIDRDLARQLPWHGDGNPDLVTLYMQGRQMVRGAKTLDVARAGAALLEEVSRRDVRHVGSRLLLAQLYNSDFWHQIAGHDVDAYRARALALARQAAVIEPENARAQLRLAWCYLRQRDWDRAERGFRTAMALVPYDADGVNEVAFGLCQLGQLEVAEPLMQRAFMLNPFPPTDYHADYAVLLALRGDAKLAEEHFEVSGDNGLLYLAVRLANRRRMGTAVPATTMLAEEFRRGFAAIWQPAMRPEPPDITAWLDTSLVLRRADDRAFLVDGVAAALA